MFTNIRDANMASTSQHSVYIAINKWNKQPCPYMDNSMLAKSCMYCKSQSDHYGI